MKKNQPKKTKTIKSPVIKLNGAEIEATIKFVTQVKLGEQWCDYNVHDTYSESELHFKRINKNNKERKYRIVMVTSLKRVVS